MRPLFGLHGVHALVDGQFGSTGKGALAAWLALKAKEQRAKFSAALSNAGPNSGHTFYHEGEKHVLKQLPTFAVASNLLGVDIPVFLTAGAVIDPAILIAEANKYPDIRIYVHANAAVISESDRETEHSGTVAMVAGTRSGTGAAIARKVLRDPTAIFDHIYRRMGWPDNIAIYRGAFTLPEWITDRIFLEVSQGFSLGINQMFYPKVTSRECTVAQGIADAGLPPASVNRTYMAVRTYPIRVGDVDGYSSGGFYPDQYETSWDAIGQKPELTTVTQRERRVFSFSMTQFNHAVIANDPDFVFLNFLNYLPEDEQRGIIETLHHDAGNYAARYSIIGGYGATSEDIRFV